MTSRRGSLSTRLLAITAVMLVAAFGITIVILDVVFRGTAEEALADQLETQVFALIGAVEPDEAGNLTIPQRLLEPRLGNPASGLYAEILDASGLPLWRSPSAVGFDLARLATRFAATGRSQLVVRQVPEPVPSAKYSEITLDADGARVTRFREKPADPQTNLSAIAVYLLPRELPALVRTYLDGGGNPDAPGHLLAWLSERIPLDATRLDGRWIDIGSAEDLARAGRAVR